MTGALRALGLTAARYARVTVILWLILLAFAGVGALTLARGATASYTVPGSSYESVRENLHARIPTSGISNGYVVLESEGGFTDAQKQAVEQAVNATSAVPQVASVINPFVAADATAQATEQLEQAKAQLATAKANIESGQAQVDAARAALPEGLSSEQIATIAPELAAQEAALEQIRADARSRQEMVDAADREHKAAANASLVSSSGTAAIVSIAFNEDTSGLPTPVRESIFSTFNQLKQGGITVNYSYELAQDVSQIFGASEVIGLAVAFLVLLVTLGAVVVAGLPLILALTGAGVAVGLLYTSTALVGMTATDPAFALMLGLGVGIDYALLILHRYREELRQGAGLREALATANSTAGRSVFFAGAINIIALSALTLTGLPFLAIMGLAGAFAVALVVLSSLTLVPAVLYLLGTRVLTRTQREERATRQETSPSETHVPRNRREALAETEEIHRGWGGFVAAHPFLMTFVPLAVLVLAIIPTTSLRLGLPDGSYQPHDSTAYQAYQTVSQEFGEGVNSPIIASVTLSVPHDEARLRAVSLDVADRLKNNRIESVAIVATSQDKSTAVLAFFPTEGSSAESTLDTVQSMLGALDSTEKATATTIGLAGAAVANREISERISDSIPIYLAVVILLCLVLMALAFRSLIAPIMATIGFLLSTLAAFGAVVAVYQWGWLGDLFGVTQPGPILAFLPILLIGILLGLSVDYQIFIVSGMRDAYRAGHSAEDSVLLGYRQGSAVVTACGLIMVAVFAGFIFSHLATVRPIGFALALGVAIDAFLIRATFIPATMYLLGDAAWWWPFGQKKDDEESP
ncbi:MMPL family transporter [Rothia nasisuis]|uniref:MMPL family transporter n=1 Tax=Rothia nasisuis TaxID=2109647 RepID=UPI001F00968C|nr:MMPL family transporter [Rothia nasisuis]